MSDQQDEEILRRRAREQAEIERQTDALVLRTLTTLVTASEELKSKLRRDWCSTACPVTSKLRRWSGQ